MAEEFTKINISKLVPFSGVLYDENNNKTKIKGNPFYVPEDYVGKNDKDSKAMQRLHASIEQDGVVTPLLVRKARTPENQDKFEILSGYRRKRVCEELSKDNPDFSEVPAIVLDCDDDMASSVITSANVQRREFSLMDTILSCGRMYRALKHRGAKNDEGRTAEIVSNILGITKRTVTRYALLIDLPDYMLSLVGHKVKNSNNEIRLSIRAGEALYGFRAIDLLNKVMKKHSDCVVSYKTAKELKKKCKGDTTVEDIEEIVLTAPAVVKTSTKRISFAHGGKLAKTINEYCKDLSHEQIEDTLSDLLRAWGEQRSV